MASTSMRLRSRVSHSGYKEYVINCLIFLLQNKEDTCFIVLNKKEGSGLGFSVAGGADVEPKSVMVSRSCYKVLGVFLCKQQKWIRTQQIPM